ncbi:hypothetical protein PMAYCL1PPCAC_08367, partial [Pristionchus mayeri]
ILYFLYAIALESMCVPVLFSTYDTPEKTTYLKQNHPAMLWLAKEHSWIEYAPDSATKIVNIHVLVKGMIYRKITPILRLNIPRNLEI